MMPKSHNFYYRDSIAGIVGKESMSLLLTGKAEKIYFS